VRPTHYQRRIGTASIVLVLIALPGSSAGAVNNFVAPLPPSDYTVRAACQTPTQTRAGCLALQLVPSTAEASAHRRPIGVASAIGIEECYGARFIMIALTRALARSFNRVDTRIPVRYCQSLWSRTCER
jgi:hypothetical protein